MVLSGEARQLRFGKFGLVRLGGVSPGSVIQGSLGETRCGQVSCVAVRNGSYGKVLRGMDRSGWEW